MLQPVFSLLSPEHGAPPSDGGGWVQVRERSCSPEFPQEALHTPQSPHGLHPPSTAAGKEGVSMNWKHFVLSFGIIIILQVQFEIRVNDNND